jgi:DNA-directed RNA polymerase sigma subunit (sigma70/sigma32)
MTPLDDQLLETLDPLSPRERKVLLLRFGLETNSVSGTFLSAQPMRERSRQPICRRRRTVTATRLRTYEEVGREFGVSPDEIEPIEQRALRKLSRSRSGRRFIRDLIKKVDSTDHVDALFRAIGFTF